ncbi:MULTISPECIES: RsfA family transcriptional regulator [Bacillus]|uniref:RsfA family transcriptional regulator n=1 Tax=Bacillus TaxID=1386 RepID=UPI000C79345D|nr:MULTISPECIES: RsfA family transcriptional regulator [Bacillus]PLR80987.1 RsfA family transcriptional regulator [Bacillus sp. V33-4]RSK53564.1 RsfA family transcriptional regulator [Bacillus canaveralius]
MSTTRQDAWSQDEDLLLAEIVLRHIREGGTQLQAFEEVGKQLSRTAAACGFRWNSYVRKQYKSGIELAKKQRKELKKNPEAIEKESPGEPQYSVPEEHAEAPESPGSVPEIRFEQVILYLNQLYEQAGQTNTTEAGKYEAKIKDLEKKTFYLAAENEKLLKELKTVEEDYRALIEVMERARKIFVLQDEDRQQQKVKFQMDKNGNLERVEK